MLNRYRKNISGELQRTGLYESSDRIKGAYNRWAIMDFEEHLNNIMESWHIILMASVMFGYWGVVIVLLLINVRSKIAISYLDIFFSTLLSSLLIFLYFEQYRTLSNQLDVLKSEKEPDIYVNDWEITTFAKDMRQTVENVMDITQDELEEAIQEFRETQEEKFGFDILSSELLLITISNYGDAVAYDIRVGLEVLIQIINNGEGEIYTLEETGLEIPDLPLSRENQDLPAQMANETGGALGPNEQEIEHQSLLYFTKDGNERSEPVIPPSDYFRELNNKVGGKNENVYVGVNLYIEYKDKAGEEYTDDIRNSIYGLEENMSLHKVFEEGARLSGRGSGGKEVDLEDTIKVPDKDGGD